MAKKEYDGVNLELEKKVNNGKQILTAVPHLELPTEKEPYMTMNLKKSYLKLKLRDYSKGTGANATATEYNLDIEAVKYLHAQLNACRESVMYKNTKIHGNYPEKEGQYRGLCRTYEINIIRSQKDQKGEIRNYPWFIKITNCYAKAAKGKIEGTFYKAPNSSVGEQTVQIAVTDMDLLAIFDAYERYEQTFLNSKEAIARYEEAYKKRLETEGNKPSTAPASISSDARPAAEAVPEEAPQLAPASQPAPAPKKEIKTTSFTGHFATDQIEEVDPKSGKAPMTFIVKGKELNTTIYFNKKDYTAILDCLMNQSYFTAEYIQNPKDGKVWFYRMSEAAPAVAEEAQAAPEPEPEQVQTASTAIPQTVNRNIKILDEEFTQLEDSVVATCLFCGREVPIYFDRITPEIDNAKGGKMEITVALYRSKDGFRCWGNAQ